MAKKITIRWRNKRVTFRVFPTVEVTDHAIDMYRKRIANLQQKIMTDDEIAMQIRIDLWSLQLEEIAECVYSGSIWYVYIKRNDVNTKYYVKAWHDGQSNRVESVVNLDISYFDSLKLAGRTIDKYIELKPRIIVTDEAVENYIFNIEPVSEELARMEIEYAITRYRTLKTDTTTKFRLAKHQIVPDYITYRGSVYNSYRKGFYVWIRNKHSATVVMRIKGLNYAHSEYVPRKQTNEPI